MWEIGKKRSDAEKEFDRTVVYLKDTIEEYKNLHREGSHISQVSGVLAQIRRGPLGVGPLPRPLQLSTERNVLRALARHPHGQHLRVQTRQIRRAVDGAVAGGVCGELPPWRGQHCVWSGSHLRKPHHAIGSRGRAGAHRKQQKQQCVDFATPQAQPRPTSARPRGEKPAVVFPDADLDLAVKECVKGAWSFNGQRCTALKVVYVHKDIREEFLEAFAKATDELVMGSPLVDADITPLPEVGKVEAMQAYIDEAVDKGATVINGRGGTVEGNMMFPAILYPVDRDTAIFREEQFGPVCPVLEFDDFHDVLRDIAESDYGQQVSVFTANHETAGKAIDQLVNQVCRVNLNATCQRGPDTLPFTGRKDSAVSTLSVKAALRSFSIRTLVACNASQKDLVEGIVAGGHSEFSSMNYLL